MGPILGYSRIWIHEKTKLFCNSEAWEIFLVYGSYDTANAISLRQRLKNIEDSECNQDDELVKRTSNLRNILTAYFSENVKIEK